jgi:DNA repair exonuclease SbcCD nuclease subunit
MIKILSSADWHINLHKKKITYAWQTSRYQQMFKKLHDLEPKHDVHVIAGDLFDREPEADEVCLLLSYLNAVSIPTIIVPGNHEATRKGKTFWEPFKLEHAISNELVQIYTENDRTTIGNQGFCMFPYGSVQINCLPEYVENDILVTHIRGEVAPHITAEYDFEQLRPWSLILLGDLHFNHKYKDYPAYYPGSPLNTTFDRDSNRQYGVDSFVVDQGKVLEHHFIDLQLPKLLRRTISVGQAMTSDGYNHIVYEVTGSIDELAKVEKHDLLDKKMVEKPTAEATLDLKNKSLIEELEIYLQHIKVAESDLVLQEFKALGIQ